MAAWQVEFHVIPQRALAQAAQPLAPAVLAGTAWWAGVPLGADHRAQLERIAAEETAAPRDRALVDVEAWGPVEGNRIEVTSQEGRVHRIVARVDVRRLDARFAAALLGFVKATGAVLVRRDGNVVDATIAGFAASLRGSIAWKHGNEPDVPMARADEDDE